MTRVFEIEGAKVSNYWQSRLGRRRLLQVGGTGVAAAAILAACGGGSSDSGSSGGGEKKDATGLLAKPVDQSKDAKKGGTWLGTHNADIQTFDPHFQSVPNQALTQIVYSRLFKAKPGMLLSLIHI